MKKLLFGICLIVVLVFTGCASSATAFVFDPGIPETEMSFLWVPNYVKVKQFGDKTVEWTAPPLSARPVKVGVPSGEYKFIIDTVPKFDGTYVSGVPNVKDKSYAKNFVTGRGYQFIAQNGEIVLLDL